MASVTDSPTFPSRVVAVLRRIPRGKVVTYGQVAAMAGSPGASRMVVRVLRAQSESLGLPWQRVINSSGGISLVGEDADIQRQLLKQEGIRFDEHGRVPLAVYQWRPSTR